MSNWFYYDNDGTKQGPINSAELKALAESRFIGRNTIIETESGRKVEAKRIKGLFPLNLEEEINDFTTPAPVTESVSSEVSDKVSYCTNCGNPVSSKAAACMKCGADPCAHRNYCTHCGEQLNPSQFVCLKCGTPIETKQKEKESNDSFSSQSKDQIVAAILAFLLGGCGVHKYYLGDKVAAIYYLLFTFLGFFMLYAYADLYTIANYGRIDDFGDLGPGYLFFVVAWGMPIIDGIYIVSLTPGEFDMKYNKKD